MMFERGMALWRQRRNQIADQSSHTSHDLNAGRPAEAYLVKPQAQKGPSHVGQLCDYFRSLRENTEIAGHLRVILKMADDAV